MFYFDLDFTNVLNYKKYQSHRKQLMYILYYLNLKIGSLKH